MHPSRTEETRAGCAQRLASDLGHAGGRPVMVRGPWATGVSWVLREASTALRRARPVDHVVAARPGAVAEVLGARTGEGSAALVVDDAHRIVGSEAEGLRDAVLNRGRVLLLGARSEVPLAEPLEWMLAAGVLAEVDLAPLGDAEVSAIMEDRVGGKVHAGTRRHVQRLAHGRAGFVTDLTDATLADGSIELRNGLWRATGGLATSLVARRLRFERRRMPAALVDPHVALGRAGSLPTPGVEGVATAEQLAGLVADGYAEVDHGRVEPTPPIVTWASLAVDGPLSPTTARRLIDAVAPAAAGPDLVRWRLAAGDRPADAELVAAASQRWQAGDPHGALEVIRHAAGSVASLRLTADLLAEVGRRSQAIAVLERIEATADAATRDAARAERATITMWMGQRDRALAISRAAVDEPDAPPAALISHALLSLEGGDLDGAASVAEAVVGAAPATDAATSILATVAALRGDGGRAVDLARQACALHTRVGIEPDVSVITLVLALGEEGALGEAQDVATAGYRRALDESRMAQAWMALCRVRIHLYQGDLARASAMALEASELFADLEHPAGLLWALAGRAIAAAGLGDAAGAASAAEGIATAGESNVSFLEPDVRRGQGWAAVAAGDLTGARRWFDAAVRAAEATGAAALASTALHDLARVGAAVDVADELDALAARLGTRWAGPRAAYGRGLAREAPTELLEAARGFHRIGADLHAFEAVCEAATMAHVGGDRPVESEANALLRRWPRPTGILTPPLARAGAADRYRLTRREREVAQRAAEGSSNRDIAAALGVSVRTVENMLHRSYHKLGVAGRSELADVLGTSPPEGD